MNIITTTNTNIRVGLSEILTGIINFFYLLRTMKDIIEAAFEDRANLNPDSATKEVKDAVNEAIYLLDSGKARVAERQGVGDWRVMSG